jgi:hypothetical protein
MKKYKFILLLLLLVGCKKDFINSPSPQRITPQDSFIINKFGPNNCLGITQSPAEIALGINWDLSDEFTTIGVFTWDAEVLKLCQDSIYYIGDEIFIYVNDGEGKIDNIWVTHYSPYIVDTIFRNDIFPNSSKYIDDTIKLGYRFYRIDNPIEISIDSILIIK